ncbi:hypothetical protein [Francisella uliginis]|uniref:Glycine zipper domain-containing protein n=1 Tax=Francisella uliginis TaxID=573570 RepID=A0A1L4BQ38_9GAMM|nr:hypothetical protein [Francisella uliginis]API85961.1 hypothetical protein F7310_00695 [Francisella uliginis]
MKKYSPIALSLLLISCSSNPEITKLGPGVVKSEEQLISKEQMKKDETKKDVLTGAGVGAGSGAAVGAGVGAGTGAIVGAGTGALVGAGGGYIYVSNKDDIIGKYKYQVLQDGKTTPVTFEQFPDKNYLVGEKVDLYKSEYKGEKTYFIKSEESKKD